MSNRPLTSDLSTWRTPPEVFNPLNEEFQFVLDSCATDGHELVADSITPEMDALQWPWSVYGGAVWCNPPYGREVGLWVKKCSEEGTRVPVVLLVFINSDTAWWHDYVLPCAAEVRCIRGRVRFIHPDTGLPGEAPAPRASCIVVFRPGHTGPVQLTSWKKR